MRFERFLSRAGGVLAGALAVGAFMVVTSMGDGGLLGLGLGGVVLAFLGGQAIYNRLPRRTVTDRWQPVPAFAPAAPRTHASSRRVALALAGPESRELGLSPAFGAGMAFCVTIVVLFGFVWPEDAEGNLAGIAELSPIFVHPLVGMVIIAAHRARTRSRRDGTEELLAACPTSPSTRNVGHLATAWLPALICVVFGAVIVALVGSRFDIVWGPFGNRQAVAVLSAGVLAVGGVALAVALARWAPWPIVPIVAVVAIGMITIQLATAGGGDEREPLRQLSTFLGDSEVNYRLTAPHYLARLGWLVSLVVLVAVIGLLKDRRSPKLLAAGMAAAVSATGFAVATARPIDTDDADRIAAMLNDPASHQECVDAAGVDVCVFDGDGALARHVAEEIEPVAAAVPAGAVDGYSFGPEATVDARLLDPEVVDQLEGASDPGLLPAVLGAHPDTLEAARLWVALAAVGAVEEWTPGTLRTIGDEARGAVALWLAVRDGDPSTVRNLTTFDPSPTEGHQTWRPWPDPCYAGRTPVQWAVADVGAARLLLDLPAGDVQMLLDERWEWVTDPATTTAELLAALGLEPTAPANAMTRAPSC